MRYQKVVKTNGTETSRYDYVYSEGKLILITYTENGTSDTARFIYDSMGEPRGFILNNTATYLYIKNAQGDITGIVNEDGDVILTCSYNAWGKVTFASTNMEYMALAAKLSKINPFTYRGYCYDYDIEMYYLQSRYYDPEICRFINADSTDYLGATGTLLSYNLFAYCENDGVNRVDYDGFAPKVTLAEAITVIMQACTSLLTAPYADYYLSNLDNIIVNWNIYKIKDIKKNGSKRTKVTRKLYSFSVYGYTHRWNTNQTYEILCFGAIKEDWEAIDKIVRSAAKTAKIGSKITIKRIISKLPQISSIAKWLRLPVQIVAFLISDASKQLKKDLKPLKSTDWFQFNWYVKYMYQDLFVQPNTMYLDAYCLMATITQGAVI